jgi:hypothetical protein
VEDIKVGRNDEIAGGLPRRFGACLVMAAIAASALRANADGQSKCDRLMTGSISALDHRELQRIGIEVERDSLDGHYKYILSYNDLAGQVSLYDNKNGIFIFLNKRIKLREDVYRLRYTDFLILSRPGVTIQIGGFGQLDHGGDRLEIANLKWTSSGDHVAVDFRQVPVSLELQPEAERARRGGMQWDVNTVQYGDLAFVFGRQTNLFQVVNIRTGREVSPPKPMAAVGVVQSIERDSDGGFILAGEDGFAYLDAKFNQRIGRH